MEIFLNISLIITSLVILFLFKKMKSLLSWQGIVFIISSGYVFVIKFFILSDFRSLGVRFDNFAETWLPITIFTVLGAVILGVMRFKDKKFKVVKWVCSLLTFYLFFGILQQAFFQAVVTHTLGELLGSTALVVIFSGIFYSAFHWDWELKGFTFGFLTLIAGSVWAMLFLTNPNIFLLGISHAILGSLYYFIVYKGNILEEQADLVKKKRGWKVRKKLNL